MQNNVNNLSQFYSLSNNNLSFHQFNNVIYVPQGKIKISKKPLFTKGLGTCSVMIFQIDNIYYLTHVDVDMNSEILYKNIKKKFNKKQLTKIKKNIYICSGKWNGNKNTRIIILKVINKLRMINKIIELKINHEDSIGINKKGIWIEKGSFKTKKYIK